ncbi:hypothetical protein OK016_23435 [Vibrio chagasii]|nr:hypothetical protein [Vibrio chagasii]
MQLHRKIQYKARAVRTTTGGHGTYLFPYEGPVDENGLPGMPGGNMSDVLGLSTLSKWRLFASMVMSDGAVVVINNEDHIETEVPQNEE